MWDSTQNWNPVATTDLINGLHGILGGAVAGTTTSPNANICFEPLCGLFSQIKLIPLMCRPVTLALEIVSNVAGAVMEPIDDGAFTPTSTTNSWSIHV